MIDEIKETEHSHIVASLLKMQDDRVVEEILGPEIRMQLKEIRENQRRIESKLDLLLLPTKARTVVLDGTICILPKGVTITDGWIP